MWPMLLDMSRDECKKTLRRLELEAYSSIVSAFRAQGDLNKDKKRILQDLQQALSISTERHRAEVRRAINDEKLATIADHIGGSNTESEWLIEGRRLVPLMPRLVPQTAFTVTANHVANVQAEKNASMPSPSMTGNKEAAAAISSPPTPVAGPSSGTKMPRPASPNSNVVVLPSGMSIHIKGGLNTDDDEETAIGRKRRKSQSTETIVSPSAGTQTPRMTYSASTTTASGNSPMKITISKSPQSRSQSTSTIPQPQKVILVSSSSQSSPSLLQKSITVPVVKTASSSGMSTPNKASIILPNASNITSSSSPISGFSNAATSLASGASGTTTPAPVTTSTMTFLTPAVNVSKPRMRTAVPRQRFAQVSHTQQKPGVVIPMGPQPVQPSPSQNIHIKSTPKAGAVQIRQEGGMKIITHGSGSKILPKPQLTTSGGTPVVVVSGGSAAVSGSTVTVSRGTTLGQGTKILNITQGGKVLNRGANVVTVNPKTLQLTAVKSGAGGKPNVIVVQKTNPRRSQAGATITKTSSITSPFEKELVSFLQKQDPSSAKHIVVSTPGGQRTIERKVIVTGTSSSQLEGLTKHRVRTDSEGKTSLLPDLIHVSSSSGSTATTESDSDHMALNLDEDAIAALTVSSQNSEAAAQSKASTTQTLPNNEWFEYDEGDDSSQNYQETTQGSEPGKAKVVVQRSANVEINQLTDQLSNQFYTLEQAMKLLNQSGHSEGSIPTSEGVSLLHVEGQPQEIVHLEATPSQSRSGVTMVSEANVVAGISKSEVSSADMEHVQHSLGLQGELDPQTGIFYSMATSGGQGDTIIVTSSHSDVAAVSQGEKTFDLLSSSLAQAQIDLDPYQFIEENVMKNSDTIGQNQGTEVVGAEVASSESETEVKAVEEAGSSGIRGTSFIPFQEVSKTDTSGGITIRQAQTSAAEAPKPHMQAEGKVQVITLQQQPIGGVQEMTLGVDTSSDISEFTALTREPAVVETDQMLDPSDIRTEMIGYDEAGNTSPNADPNSAIRLSKRKRKPPLNIEDSPTQAQTQGSWTRSCLGLILRVSRYRGLNREKGDLNAASWFTEPVDPLEVPDYYTIIKQPMDFGTIRRKLEGNMYNSHEEFHSDMLLVRDNCRIYNPPGSTVRRDCDEVFAFYLSEFEKLLEKWQKTHIASSPASKKLKFESKSPVR